MKTFVLAVVLLTCSHSFACNLEEARSVGLKVAKEIGLQRGVKVINFGPTGGGQEEMSCPFFFVDSRGPQIGLVDVSLKTCLYTYGVGPAPEIAIP